jgi:hypothetical protein
MLLHTSQDGTTAARSFITYKLEEGAVAPLVQDTLEQVLSKARGKNVGRLCGKTSASLQQAAKAIRLSIQRFQ